MNKIKISGEVGKKLVEKNGKKYHIFQAELNKLMQTLDITEEEAIETWLFDHGFEDNEEVNELSKKAKVNKTDKIVVTDKTKRKQVNREPKVNTNKQTLINCFFNLLVDKIDGVTYANITNPQKLIEFTFNGKQYKLDLIEKREPKK